MDCGESLEPGVNVAVLVVKIYQITMETYEISTCRVILLLDRLKMERNELKISNIIFWKDFSGLCIPNLFRDVFASLTAMSINASAGGAFCRLSYFEFMLST